MGLNVVEVTSGGQFFKPEEQKDAIAILVEVRRFAPQVPSKFGPKDTIYADLTVFGSQSDLDAGKPSAEFKNAEIQQTVLVKNLQGVGEGNATIAKLTKLPPKNGNQPAWAWANVSGDTKDRVLAYGNAREAAKAQAAASAPSFE